jgi:hypothetical protein
MVSFEGVVFFLADLEAVLLAVDIILGCFKINLIIYKLEGKIAILY